MKLKKKYGSIKLEIYQHPQNRDWYLTIPTYANGFLVIEPSYAKQSVYHFTKLEHLYAKLEMCVGDHMKWAKAIMESNRHNLVTQRA